MNKFEGNDGKVVFFDLEEVKHSYPIGTLKLEVKIYPPAPGSYSSFIYTEVSASYIESIFEKIAEHFLNDHKNSYSSKEISDILSKYVMPLFPQEVWLYF